MSIYKSLVFREWKLSKKHYILRVILFSLLAALFLLAMAAGNKTPTEENVAIEGFIFIASYFIGMVAAVIVAEDNGVYKADVNSGWLAYSWALPITAFEKALAKYIFKTVLVITGTVVTVLTIAGMYVLSDATFNINAIYPFFVIVDAVLIYDLIRHVIIMHAVDKKKLKMLGHISGVIVALIMFLPGMFSDDKSSSVDELFDQLAKSEGSQGLEVFDKLMELVTIPHYLGIIAIVLMFVILFISFVVTWKGYERRRV